MAEEAAAQVTTDTAGVNRTSDGQITTAPATDQSNQNTSQASQAQTPTQTPTDQTTTAKPKEGETLLSKDKDAAAEGAPETYADYKVPEGFAMDPGDKTEIDKVFKGLNLAQDQAQQLVDLYIAKTREAQERPFKAYQDERQEWRTKAENDPELRGKLGVGGEVKTTIARALNSLNDAQLASDFFAAMDYTGVGDNPAFIKAFYRMSQMLSEGSHVAGRGPSAQGQGRPGTVRTPATDLWPNLPSQARG